MIIDLLDPGAIAAAADPAGTLDLGATLADIGLSGTAATDPTALAITDLPDLGPFAAAADPGPVAAAADPAGSFPLSELLAYFGLVGNGTPDSPELAAAFQEYIYQPAHTFIQAWIGSPFGQQFDNGINSLFSRRATSAA